MKVIINGFFENPSVNKAFVNLLNNFDVSKCHAFTCIDTLILKEHLPIDINFHDFHQTILGKYTNINWNEIMPLDEYLIYKMTDCESIVLKMMDRLSVVMTSYTERKRMYLKHLRYWNHIITKENIDLFLASGIPHEIYDFIIYKLCKLKNIPTIIITQSAIDGVSFISEDLEKEPSQSIAKDYIEIINNPPEEITLSERFRNHYITQISLEKDPVPWYMDSNPSNSSNQFTSTLVIKDSDKKIRNNLLAILGKLFNFSKILNKAVDTSLFLQRNQESKTMFQLYEGNTVEPNLQQKYIYIALHYQPECTTSPMAGAFVDQLLIVQMLAHLVPPDIYLYVKEHPHQTSHARTIDFYKDLLDIPQVRLIPRSYNSFRLIENCLAVATATGTAGWEGLFRQKPVLMFGHHFYEYAPKVFSIHSLEDCRIALNQIINQNVKPSLYEMEVFLKAIEVNSVIAYSDMAYSKFASITDKQNTDNIFSALQSKLIELGFTPIA